MLPLCKVVLPINAAKFFKSISEIAAFEVYDMNDAYHGMLSIPPTDPFSDNFEELGFESKYILNNMGVMVFFYLLYPVFLIIYSIMFRYCRTSNRCKKFQKSYREQIYWKAIIIVVYESYAIVAMSCFIGLPILDFSTAGLAVQSISCLFFTVFMLVMPVFLIKYSVKNFPKLSNYKTSRKIGALYEDLNMKVGAKIFWQPSFFLIRRLILAASIVLLN